MIAHQLSLSNFSVARVWLRIQAELIRFVYRVRYLEFIHVLKLLSLFVAFRVNSLQSVYPVAFSGIQLLWGCRGGITSSHRSVGASTAAEKQNVTSAVVLEGPEEFTKCETQVQNSAAHVHYPDSMPTSQLSADCRRLSAVVARKVVHPRLQNRQSSPWLLSQKLHKNTLHI